MTKTDASDIKKKGGVLAEDEVDVISTWQHHISIIINIGSIFVSSIIIISIIIIGSIFISSIIIMSIIISINVRWRGRGGAGSTGPWRAWPGTTPSTRQRGRGTGASS